MYRWIDYSMHVRDAMDAIEEKTSPVVCPVCLSDLPVYKAKRGFTAWCPFCRVRVFLPPDAGSLAYREAAAERIVSMRSER